MFTPRRTLTIIIAVLALGAIAYWPTYLRRTEAAAKAAALPTPAPVQADYLTRDKSVAFWEGMVHKHIYEDMLSPRQLSEQYLQRYRERGDIDDVFRAEHAAEASLKAQPRGNIGAELELASDYLTLHQFYRSIAMTKNVEALDPGDPLMYTREASLDMEIGNYAGAAKRLDQVPEKSRDDSWRVVESRYLELTGHLAEARDLLAKAAADANAQYDAPAQSRAWYFFRQGEMTFEAGDDDGAIALEKQALTMFPTYADANRLLAKYECAEHKWQACLDAAIASANVIPYPETLGYEVDAYRGLGRTSDAAQTDDLIVTEERIGNAQRISDRLLAIYYSDHRLRPADAYAIAKRELAVRQDIFTWDTLAWAAAMDDKWAEARTDEAKAMTYGTQISLLYYHAGIIALHFGDTSTAKSDLQQALALNPQFHPTFADDARAQLAKL
jgi:tetratricopeptide (TPR) repeat protein